jgi:hypothetical protein
MRSRALPLRWHLTIFGVLLVTPIFLALIVLSILYVHTQRAAIRAEADNVVREATRLIDNEIARETLALKALSASAYLVGEISQTSTMWQRKLPMTFPAPVLLCASRVAKRFLIRTFHLGLSPQSRKTTT